MESSDLSSVPTRALVEHLKTCGFDVPPALADEIVRRGREALDPLIALVRDDALWSAMDTPARLSPIHAAYLLGAIGDAACAPALIRSVKTRSWGDFVAESAPSIFAALDPAAIPALQDAALDPAPGAFERAAFASGLYGIAARHPPHRAEVAAFFTRILREPDDLLVSLLIEDAARIDDPAVQGAVDAAFERGRVDPRVILRHHVARLRAEPRWSLSRDIRDPMAYFRDGLLAHLKRSAEEQLREAAAGTGRAASAPKVGRNDPCPCGSGKKYKKCCLP